MYERFFNLTADPFRLSPDHRFCYKHSQYSKAKAYMAYAFRRAEGFVLVTGPPGTGKTTLIGDLLEYLAGRKSVVANLVSTQLAADDLLRSVAFAFDVEADNIDKASILQRLTTRFLDIRHSGERALLIVDEAQDLSSNAMEELRLLTNLQLDDRPLLQIFLLGQPELRDIVQEKYMAPLHQRIIAASHLKAMGKEETRRYVEHRLNVVNWRNDPRITPGAFSVIYMFSEGIPRRINLICNRMFLHAFVEKSHRITVADARVVVKELQKEQLSTRNLLDEAIFYNEERNKKLASRRAPVEETPATPVGKAKFEAQDPSLFAHSEDQEDPKKYMGPEQRRGHRRQAVDRREDIRFEVDKKDRRKKQGRREDDETPDFW